MPVILEHGQIVGRLVYENMLERPQRLYGTGIGSNYQAQSLKLSKHFKA
jgi:dCTP deaminase